jgi:hypothetical protein
MSSVDKNRLYSRIFLLVIFVACPLTIALGSVVFGGWDILEGKSGWWRYLITLIAGVAILRFVYVALTAKDTRSVYERAEAEYTNWLAGKIMQRNIMSDGGASRREMNAFERDFESEKAERLEQLEQVRNGFFNNVINYTKD